MSTKSEIFVVGYYGFRNTGDELILESILSDLREALPETSITATSHAPRITAAKHGIRAVKWNEPQAIIEATQRADLVLVGGGGLFHDTLGFGRHLPVAEQSWGLGLYAGAAIWGSLVQKRVMLWGVGVGPLKSQSAREYTRAACLAADVITVRDEPSKGLLVKLGVPARRVIVTADPVFALKTREAGLRADDHFPAKQSSQRPRVAVVVREWSVDIPQEQWERQLIHALQEFLRTEGGQLIFLPFQALESEEENDLAVAQRIASRLGRKGDVSLVREPPGPGETREMIAGCDLVVGMRFHSVALAAQTGVPVVALTYDPKVSSLLDRVGMLEFSSPLRDIQPARLQALMCRALRRKPEISVSLRAASERLAREAGRNVRLACELLQSPVQPKPLPAELLPIVAGTIQEQAAAAARSAAQAQSQTEKIDELSACVSKQNADNEELIEEVRQQHKKVEELSAFVNKQHAEKEGLIASLKERHEKVEELAACVRRQHADNEELISALAQKRTEREELQTRLWQRDEQAAGLEKRLQELTQSHSRTLSELEVRKAAAADLEQQLEENRKQHAAAIERMQTLELQAADLKRQLATEQELRRDLEALLRSRRFSVRIRRSIHEFLDYLQPRLPNFLRRAVRGLYLPLYRFLFPSGKSEFETLDRLKIR